ncbi:uncharacterized protein LOC103316527 [Nasonia vitripennis]|uniref:Endonuclease/exonuclease/phosphatase domain-containing protein n=1 Tax=Nasonia vitripennis TaxID=7425 RepID=A0A7M7H568_NASVI|nr:uncharacterized protein LOC103316527 [Nasonia vitripennis]
MEAPTEEVTRLVEYCEERGLSLVVGCDATAHHLVWGHTNTNDRGTTLLEYLTSTNLEITNRGNDPTFMNVRRREVIDITLCSRQLVRGIVTTGNMDQKPQANELEGIQEEPGGETQNKVPNTHDRRAKHCGRIAAEGHREKLKKATQALLRKAVKSNDGQKWIAWRSKQKEYRHAVKKAQTESWREYCSSVKAGKEAARLNKILARNPEAWLGAVKLPTGKYTESDEETLEHLMEPNFPGL